jgi:RHS repeat-associated protein
MRGLLAAAVLLAAGGSALAQTTACNPPAPQLSAGKGFVPFGANEQAHARGGNAGPGWEWALGTDTETSQKAKGGLDWVSGRIYEWTLIYSAAGAATLEVRHAGALVLSLSYPSGMDAGNGLELQVATNQSIGPDTTIAATLTSLKGQPVSGSISQTGNNQESSQREYFYYPAMAQQGFAAQGTVSLVYKSLPVGSRVDFKLRSGTLPCSNVAPTVSISAPAANALFHAPASINIETTVADGDGTVAQVEFFANGSLIGMATSAPFSFNWTNVAAGAYSLAARATDNAGDQTASAAVPILVNAPPAVTLTSPTTNAFTAPASIPVTAEAADDDGSIANVAFYYGDTHITTLTSPPYSFTWTAVPQGNYSLTARATDDRGATAISGAMAITVRPPAPAARALYFIHADHLNTPRLVADAGGTTVWQWDQHEPFGSNPPDENPSGRGVFEMPLRFLGQYRDAETALQYNYFRDYDAGLGRYVEADPLGIATSWPRPLGANVNHLYSYVGGAPLNFYDPFGQDRWGDRDKDPWYPRSGTKPPFPTRPDGQPWGWGCGDEDNDHIVPDSMWGVNVTPACRNHDRCYERACQPGVTKERCDDGFHDDVVSVCRAAGRPLAICRALAWQYYQGVKVGGDKSFNREKNKCC